MTIQALRVLVTQEMPNLVFLMETKNQEQMVHRVRRRLKFQNCFLVDPDGVVGGLAIF